MPRPQKPWLRKQTGWYCLTVNGEVVKLSKDKAEADRLFHRLLAEHPAEPARQLGVTFRKLADEFLVHTQSLKNAETFAIQKRALQAFCDHAKGVRAAELKGHVVTGWLAYENRWRAKAGRKTWNPSTQSIAVKAVKAALNWGVRQGYLELNPIKGLGTGKVPRRDRVLTPEERRRIEAFVCPEFAAFLSVVGQTGARPYSEIAKLEARHVDFAAGTATLAEHKTSRKTGRPRVIYFTPPSLAILKDRVEKRPTGFLFRTRRGSAWNRNNGRKWFSLIKEKLGIAAFGYAYRHTRITEAIINGVPVEVVAELCGNTPQVIHQHYAHVAKDQAALRAAAVKAVG